jgi:uncharacterized membrane protein
MAKEKTALGIEENLEGALCYLGWWITGLIFFLLEPKNKFIRFHAMQSIVVFLGATIIIFVLFWIPFFGWILSGLISLLSLILWIVLMIKAYQGEKFKVPIAGDIAEKNS